MSLEKAPGGPEGVTVVMAGAPDPVIAGTPGDVLAKWATFVPSFMIILVGAPCMEALRSNKALNAVMTSITAAVVGLILNLAVWFGLHTLFARVESRHISALTLQVPDLSSLDRWAVVLAAAAAVMLLRFRIGMVTTLCVCCVAGIAIHLSGWL